MSMTTASASEAVSSDDAVSEALDMSSTGSGSGEFGFVFAWTDQDDGKL